MGFDLTASSAPLRNPSSSSLFRRRASGEASFRRPVTVRQLLFGGAALLLLLVVGFVVATLTLVTGATDRITERRLLDSAATASMAIDAELSKYLGVLQALAAGWEASGGDLDLLYQQAVSLHRQHAGSIGLALIGADQRQIFNARRPLGDLLPPSGNPDLVNRVQRTRQPAVSDLFVGPVSSQPMVALGVPLSVGSGPPFVLTASIEARLFQALLENAIKSGAGITALVDRQDFFIARRQSPETTIGARANETFRMASLHGGSGLFEGRSREGIRTVAAFHRSSLTGWKTVAALPAEGLEPELRRLLWLVGTGGTALVVLVLAVTAWFGNRLARGIGRLSLAAVELGRGQQPNIPSAGLIEIDRVATALESAAVEREQSETALIAAREEAEQANHAKGEFLAHMSHELRTPLNAIIGFAELIENRALGGVPPDRYLSYAGDIRLSGQHLLEIINDILQMARLDTMRLDLREAAVDIRAVVSDSLAVMRPLAADAEVELLDGAAEFHQLIQGDERVLRQILLNLLSNAVKFTPAGGSVTVSAAAADEGGLVVTVADTGRGIDPRLIPTLFQPFNRRRAVISEPGAGAGLGLAISKRLVALHGGRLELTSEPGIGTVASVWLPAERLLRL